MIVGVLGRGMGGGRWGGLYYCIRTLASCNLVAARSFSPSPPRLFVLSSQNPRPGMPCAHPVHDSSMNGPSLLRSMRRSTPPMHPCMTHPTAADLISAGHSVQVLDPVVRRLETPFWGHDLEASSETWHPCFTHSCHSCPPPVPCSTLRDVVALALNGNIFLPSFFPPFFLVLRRLPSFACFAPR